MTGTGLKHPGRWLWLFVAIPIAIGFARLHFDLEVLNLLPQDMPAVQGLKAYQENFTSARELIVTFSSANPELLETQVRAVVEALRGAPNAVETVTWQAPWRERPSEAAELIAWLWLNQSPEKFEALVSRIRSAPEQFAAAREQLATSLSPQDIARLSYDPLGFTEIPGAGSADMFSQEQQVFSNEDGTFRLMFVTARPALRSYKDCEQWIAQIRTLVGGALAAQPAPGPRVGYTGRPAFVAEIARGMQRDMTGSIVGTAGIIALLFWIAHRSFKPLLWLLTLLAVILVGTLGLGGLLFGTINVVSMGFAAILLGLAVDYALLHYQEAITHKELTVPQVRRVIAPGVAWAAITTIAGFLALNLGGLPGLAQLGTIVAVGVAFGALVIVFEYLPPLFPERSGKSAVVQPIEQPAHSVPEQHSQRNTRAKAWGFVFTLLLLAGVGGTLWRGLPGLDTSAEALRPRGSPAYAAMSEVQRNLVKAHEPVWILISGANPGPNNAGSNFLARAEAVQSVLSAAVSNGTISSYTLPLQLAPNPDHAQQNLETARSLAASRGVLHKAAATAGFAEPALGLADRILDAWQNGRGSWPTNELSKWILGKVIAQTSTNTIALGLMLPANRNVDLAQLNARMPEGVWVTSWEALGKEVFGRVQQRFLFVFGPMCLLVLLSLALAFRNSREVLLSIASLSLSAFCLLTIMRLLGWSWNLMNLMAIPLILGAGVDYGIFMQLALRRHQGNIGLVLSSTGRALLLCAGTAVAGFGSLAFSSNAGMAALGRVCAVGIGCNVIVAVALLPFWWSRFADGRKSGSLPSPQARPSRLYNASLWRIGTRIVRALPAAIMRPLAEMAAGAYGTFARERRSIVTSNLLPVLGDQSGIATGAASRLFRQFGGKLYDLLWYEAGLPIQSRFGNATGIELLHEAAKSGRGTLLLTLHLGNWEFGAPWLAGVGINLHVITQPEPGQDFTELRRKARERWNVKTIIVGNDSFAFLEVIRLLESGGIVALLMDRPPPPTGVEVKLFGRPFQASVSAAELARATGCNLLTSHIVWHKDHYEGHILPPVPYDRASLRSMENRVQLTQEIMSRFEPAIRTHADQWYHFVPLWQPGS